MRIVFRFFSLAAAVLGTAACSLMPAPRETGGPAPVRVCFETVPSATRTAFMDPEGDSYPAVWQEGDRVKLFLNGSEVNPDGDKGVMTASLAESGRKATFAITLPDPGALESFNYGVLSPAGAFSALDGETRQLSLVIPENQQGTASSPDPAAMLLWAAAGPYGRIDDPVKLGFRHLTAYGKLSLTGLQGTLSTVELVSDRDLAGVSRFPAQTSPGAWDNTLEPVSAAQRIRIAATDPGAVWFACVPGDWSGSTLQVTATTSQGHFTRTVTFPQDRVMRPGQVARFSVDMTEASGKTDTFDEAHVVFSFGALSDVHINSPSNAYAQKFTSALRQLRDRAAVLDADGLDAVVVAGDLTDTPTNAYAQTGYFRTLYEQVFDPKKVPMIYTIGNHDANSGYRWNPNTVMQAAVMAQVLGDNYFLTDQDQGMRTGFECRHNVVAGYHVLSLTPTGMTPVTYPAESKAWLDGMLQSLTAAEPERFVFVNTHPMIEDTVYGSLLGTQTGMARSDIWYSSSGDYWATRDLTSILEKYPQVVTLGGHLHFPLNDPRSLWQGDFTAVGCGSVRYMAIENGKYEGMKSATVMNDSEEFSQGWLMQVDRNGNLRATPMDFYRSAVIGSPYEIPYPRADKTHLTRYAADRATRNRAPVLDASRLQMTAGEDGKVSVEWARGDDDEFVHHYVLKISRNGTAVLSGKYLADFYLHPQPSGMKDPWTVKVGSLMGGDYEVSLTAYDSWDASATVSRTVRVEGPEPPEAGLYADIDFTDGQVRDSKGKVSVTNMGATIAPVTVSHGGRSYTVPAMQAGVSKYVQCRFNEVTSTIGMAALVSQGFSIETMFVDRAPGAGENSVHGIFCGTQAGGWGLALRGSGVPYFIVGETASGANAWRSLDAASAASTTALTHVVCTYDPAGMVMKLFVNGQLSASKTSDINGVYRNGEGTAYNQFCLGADVSLSSYPDYPCTDMIITDAKFYIGALDAAAVQAAYENAVNELNP